MCNFNQRPGFAWKWPKREACAIVLLPYLSFLVKTRRIFGIYVYIPVRDHEIQRKAKKLAIRERTALRPIGNLFDLGQRVARETRWWRLYEYSTLNVFQLFIALERKSPLVFLLYRSSSRSMHSETRSSVLRYRSDDFRSFGSYRYMYINTCKLYLVCTWASATVRAAAKLLLYTWLVARIFAKFQALCYYLQRASKICSMIVACLIIHDSISL